MSLQTLAADSDLESILEALSRDGACILKDVVSSEEIDQLLSEMGPFIENGAAGNDDFTGFSTKRIGALVARNQRTGDCAYARGDGTYRVARCP